MARGRSARRNLNQPSFEAFAEPLRGVRTKVNEARKSFMPELRPGQMLARHVELGPDDFQTIIELSDVESKDFNNDHEAAVRKGIADDVRNELWTPNGDPALIFDRRGGLIEGLKTVKDFRDAGRVVRVLCVFGIDPEARFSTDDTLKPVSARRTEFTYRENSLPPPAAEPFDGGADSDVRLAIELRDGISRELGYPVLPDLTAAKLLRARPDIPDRSTPRHVVLLAGACLEYAAPQDTDAFMRGWGGHEGEPPSAAAMLAGRPFRDAKEFLATLAIAAELFVDGVIEDPWRARAASRRERRAILQTLFGYANRIPDRLVSCRLVRVEVEELGRTLERVGRADPPAEELRRIDPLTRDVRRNRGLDPNGQTLKYDEDGVLVDGFDRVLACYVARRPLVAFASFNLPRDFDHARPRGRRQSIGHRLYADGYVEPYDIQSTLGNVYRMSENDRSVRFTNVTLRHMQNLHPQVQDIVMFIRPLETLVKASVLGPCHLALSRFSRDLADSFSSELLRTWKGEPVGGEERRRVLSKLVAMLEKAPPGSGFDDDHLIGIVFQAMDAWCNEKPLHAFRPLPDVGFHRLPMPPQIRRIQEEAKVIRAARKADGDAGIADEEEADQAEPPGPAFR